MNLCVSIPVSIGSYFFMIFVKMDKAVCGRKLQCCCNKVLEMGIDGIVFPMEKMPSMQRGFWIIRYIRLTEPEAAALRERFAMDWTMKLLFTKRDI